MKYGGDTTSVIAFSFAAGKMQNMANRVFLLPMCTFTYVSHGSVFLFARAPCICWTSTESGQKFGTVANCDMAQNSRCKLLQKESAPAVCKYNYERRKIIPMYEAYENLETFLCWSDCLYDAAREDAPLLSTLGSIMGKSGLGKDGIFPHEYVRIALEKYSDDELTRNVAFGWLNIPGPAEPSVRRNRATIPGAQSHRFS